MWADLSGKSPSEVFELLEKGLIGHRDVMRYIGTDSLEVLVRTMHLNGRMMPGHQPFKLTRGAWEALLAVTAPRDATPDGAPGTPTT